MAFKFISVLSLLIAVTGTYAQEGMKGGFSTSSTAHPYYVSIEDLGGEHMCGGALISKDLVLSSASCISKYGANRLLARLGDDSVVPFADATYDKGTGFTIKNDIGLAKLETPITESSTTAPIKVATSNVRSGTAGVIVAVDQFGRLTEARAQIISPSLCASSQFFYKPGDVKSSEVCAVPKSLSVCNMSSGSPLVADNELVGVASAYVGCGKKGRPAVYTNVASVSAWIESASKEL